MTLDTRSQPTLVPSIPLSRPDLVEEDIQRAVEVLRTGMLVQGPRVAGLERALSTSLAGREVRAVANGTAALHLALVALGVGPGDEVVVPAFSFVATANVVELVGATPVFVDIEAETFNVDVDRLEGAITGRTRAILPVHEFGLACDIERIVAIGAARGVPVIEDAACALGATSGGRPAGTFGAFGCFSLHPRKAVTAGEGGLVVTADPRLARQIELLRNHGLGEARGVKDCLLAGFNYRLTEFQAALVESQLARLPRNLAYRAKLAALYHEEIRNPLVTLPTTPDGKGHAWQTFHVLLDDALERPSVMRTLQDAGIQTSLGAQCIPVQAFYSDKYQIDCPAAVPNAWRAWRQGLAIPMSENLTVDDARYVAAQINQITC